MTTLNNFMKKYNLKNESTSSAKILEVSIEIGLKDFNINIRTDKLTTIEGNVKIIQGKVTGYVSKITSTSTGSVLNHQQ